MIFMICEHLREQIADINDGVLNQYTQIKKAQEEKEKEESGPLVSNVDHLTYTPVNKDTFGKWCKEFMDKLKQMEDQNKTEQDLRQTGKEIFMVKGANSIDFEITLDSEAEDIVFDDMEEEKDQP